MISANKWIFKAQLIVGWFLLSSAMEHCPSFLVFLIYFLHVCPTVFLFLPGLTECSCELLLQARKRCLSLEPVVRREPCQESSGQAPVEALHWPRVTDSELQKVSRKYPFWLHSVEKFFTNCYVLVNVDASDFTGDHLMPWHFEATLSWFYDLFCRMGFPNSEDLLKLICIYVANIENDPWPSFSPKANVTPLFEKILSASDADLKLARLIIPKRCAEVSRIP